MGSPAMVDAGEGVAVTAEGETGEDLEADVDALEAAAAVVIAEAVAAVGIVAVGHPPTGPCHARGRDPRAPGKEEGAGRDRGLGRNKKPPFPSAHHHRTPHKRPERIYNKQPHLQTIHSTYTENCAFSLFSFRFHRKYTGYFLKYSQLVVCSYSYE